MGNRSTVTSKSKDSLTESLQNGFYLIDKVEILAATTPEYRSFLKEAGYGDLDSCSRIEIAKGILKYDQAVRNAATSFGLSLTGNDGDYVVDINNPDGRRLVEALGYKLPTAGFMYRLFIPYIKELSQQGNAEAQETLNEMINKKAEWLEDLILNRNKVRIGTKERQLDLPAGNRVYFERKDINEFGYPNTVKTQTGEFGYWSPSVAENAVIRGRGVGVGLSLDRAPSFVSGGLGVRCAKIF